MRKSMAEYIPSKQSIPHAKELILKRIKLEENCIEKPFDTGEIYALQKAALVMDAYEQGYLVERKKGKWMLAEDGWYCSVCELYPPFDCDPEEKGIPYCPNCSAEMSPTLMSGTKEAKDVGL